MEADTLHKILLGDLPLGKALADGKLKMRGPVWNAKDLEAVFHNCQKIYPTLALDLDKMEQAGI
jgi:hypothetical protein